MKLVHRNMEQPVGEREFHFDMRFERSYPHPLLALVFHHGVHHRRHEVVVADQDRLVRAIGKLVHQEQSRRQLDFMPFDVDRAVAGLREALVVSLESLPIFRCQLSRRRNKEGIGVLFKKIDRWIISINVQPRKLLEVVGSGHRPAQPFVHGGEEQQGSVLDQSLWTRRKLKTRVHAEYGHTSLGSIAHRARDGLRRNVHDQGVGPVRSPLDRRRSYVRGHPLKA
mmetsp:Transcript_25621/g.54465  ORF Transcript_25621/g.54465 Transcript_25621/m.54465 type:complete len:225 (+) Transcript_25621:438-1112(+)